jgi:ribosome-associated protein
VDGQNVNKVSSKVVLTFDVQRSGGLSDEEKELLKVLFEINHGFCLILNCDEDRSQFRNKEIVTKRFLEVIKKGLEVPKIRKATKSLNQRYESE